MAGEAGSSTSHQERSAPRGMARPLVPERGGLSSATSPRGGDVQHEAEPNFRCAILLNLAWFHLRVHTNLFCLLGFLLVVTKKGPLTFRLRLSHFFLYAKSIFTRLVHPNSLSTGAHALFGRTVTRPVGTGVLSSAVALCKADAAHTFAYNCRRQARSRFLTFTQKTTCWNGGTVFHKHFSITANFSRRYNSKVSLAAAEILGGCLQVARVVSLGKIAVR